MGRVGLGVNVDHVATLRQARRVGYPDPVDAALRAERAGADSITVHLREDRRHIQDRDVEQLVTLVRTKLNLEIAATPEMVGVAAGLRPRDVCLVPERREELTTEGGLDVVAQRELLRSALRSLGDAGIRVSLFVDPDPAALEAARELRAPVVELHTGRFADATDEGARRAELERLRKAAREAARLGLRVNAGHGLRADNAGAVAAIPEVEELNIGHSIVARAIVLGIEGAVREMRLVLDEARGFR